MARSQNKILFIVEGEKTEPKIITKYSKSIEIENEIDIEIISFKTNIYVLYKKIKELNEGFFDDSTSTIETLKSIFVEQGLHDEAKLLDEKYPYIYLMFDLEFQDGLYDDKKEVLEEMLDYFNDETDNGLLLINYPMIESFRDYKKPAPSNEFIFSKVSLAEISDYKKIVGLRGNNDNFSKYSKKDFDNVALQNIQKANYIVNNCMIKPPYEDFLNIVLGKEIFYNQFDLIDCKKEFYILCTSSFVFAYYFGKRYYDDI